MGHALLNLTSLLDRKIHRGWHKLVGEATDVNETVTVELGGEVGSSCSGATRHNSGKGRPSTTPKPPSRHRQASAPASRATRRKKYSSASRRRAWPRHGARARQRAAARACPSSPRSKGRGAGRHDRGGGRGSLVGGGLYLREPLDVPVLEPRGLRDAARCRSASFSLAAAAAPSARWRRASPARGRAVRAVAVETRALATEVATGFPFLLHGVPAPSSRPFLIWAITVLAAARAPLRRARLPIEGRDVVRLASAAREGPRCCRRSPTAASAAEPGRGPGVRRRSSTKRTAGSRCPSTTTRTGPPRSCAERRVPATWSESRSCSRRARPRPRTPTANGEAASIARRALRQ